MQDQIEKQAVIDALERILLCSKMVNAPRMERLLEYIVHETLEGRADSLKGYTIGVDVFDRDASFDPDSDSIVRVQMGRLRKTIDNYYLTTGKDDPVRIKVPTGTYVPQFIRNEPEVISVQERITGGSGKSVLKRLVLWGCAFALVVIVGLLAYWRFIQSGAITAKTEPNGFRIEDLLDGPMIAVFPFRDLSPGNENAYLQKGIAIELISNLSRFKNLFVLGQDTTLYNPDYIKNPLKAGNRLGVNYVVTGSYAQEGDILRITAQLQSDLGGRVIWSNTYRKHILSGNILDVQSRIARSIASKLGQPYGIINRSEKHRLIRDGKFSPTAYKCVLRYYDYAHGENEVNHLKVRNCLEQAIKRQPDYAQALAALSWIYVDEHRQGFNPKQNDIHPIDRALSLARKAVELDPDDAFTHRQLANVFIAKGDMRLARDEINKALALNPNDSNVLADVGWIAKNLGGWNKAFFHAMKAIALNPGHPPWYLETPFLYYYRNQDCQNSFSTAKSYYKLDSTILLPHVFMVASSALCGNQSDIALHANTLNSSFPGFLESPGKTLKKLSVPADMIPMMLEALSEAGVKLKKSSV